MEKVAQPHDTLFKAAFSNKGTMRDLLTSRLPKAMLDAIDLATLNIQKTDFITSNLKKRLCDMLYSVRLRGSNDAYVYILVEAQSSPDPNMHIRLLKYDIAIKAHHMKQGHKKLPEVLKIVLYTGKRDPRMSANIKNDLKKHQLETCLFCSALFIILQEDDDNRIKQKEAKAALAELLLKHGGTKNFKQYFNHNEGAIFELINASTYSDEAFFYIWDQSGIPLKELLDKLTPDTKQRIMSGLQQMRQQSMELGRQEGMERGLERGMERGIERGMEKGIQHEKQEVLRTLTRFAEKGKISQQTMQDILKEI